MSLENNIVPKSKFLENYNVFLEHLKCVFSDSVENVEYFLNESDDDKYTRCLSFVSSFNDENFDLFVKSKLKVFSHKSPDTLAISSSLFMVNNECKLYLKELLNNQPDELKKIIWNDLHLLYLTTESTKDGNNQSQSRLEKLVAVLSENDGSIDKVKMMKERLNQVIGDDINDATKMMLNDMVEGFSKILENPNTMFPEMLNITTMITTKYADKINSGEIEVEKVLKSSLSSFPNLNQDMVNGILSMLTNKNNSSVKKEKVVMDENFSTANVEQGTLEEKDNSFKVRSLLPVLSSLNKMQGSNNIMEMASGMLTQDNIASFQSMMGQMQESGQMGDMMSSLQTIMGQMKESGQMDEMMSSLQTMMSNSGEENNLQDMFKQLQQSDQVKNMVSQLQQSEQFMGMVNQFQQSDLYKSNEDTIVDMQELLNLTRDDSSTKE